MRKILYYQLQRQETIDFCKSCWRKISRQKKPRFRAVFHAVQDLKVDVDFKDNYYKARRPEEESVWTNERY